MTVQYRFPDHQTTIAEYEVPANVWVYWQEPFQLYPGLRFMSNLNLSPIFDKPVTVSNGVTTHLPDPDLDPPTP